MDRSVLAHPVARQAPANVTMDPRQYLQQERHVVARFIGPPCTSDELMIVVIGDRDEQGLVGHDASDDAPFPCAGMCIPWNDAGLVLSL
jgi:hypothetical protein